MDATTWKWIEPIPMNGFRGWRYCKLGWEDIKVIGDWLDDKPEI
jgi:hypothetical protein